MKFLGGLFILCASVFVSYLYEKKQKSKLKYLCEIIDFIRYAKGQIEFFSTPYHKIIENYTKNEDLRNIINTNFKVYCDYFNTEEITVIKNFFSSIGKGFINEEVSLCQYTILSLEKSKDKINLETPNKIKIFRSMSLFLALSIIILLV